MNEKKEQRLSKEAELNFFFEEAMDHRHTRIQFIRKERKEKGKVVSREKIGVMVACISPTDINKVIIGFSLCHGMMDTFDRLDLGAIRCPDFGKLLAHRRAMKYADKTNVFVHTIKVDERKTDTVYIPQTVHEHLEGFISNLYKYYKDKQFPAWALKYAPKPYKQPDHTQAGEDQKDEN